MNQRARTERLAATSRVDDRRSRGRSLRRRVPRGSHADWKPSVERPDPIALLTEANAGRIPRLLPLKFFRMASSPFSFFRGAAPLMAFDLSRMPATGILTQICGDAHVRNVGAYAAPDGHLVFDLNDFDETLRGPWEWDLKRLAASLVLAGREAGASRGGCKSAVRTLCRSYRDALDRLSGLFLLDLLRLEVRRPLAQGVVQEVLAKAKRVTHAEAFKKLTLRRRQGRFTFHDRPPLLEHVPTRLAREVLAALVPYRETLGPERQLLFDAYRPVDVAFKVVGTGSVGTLDFVVLLLGRGPEDPLILQVKQALPSCYARYRPDLAAAEHEGRRVAEGQHRMQSATDPLLGWTTIAGRHFIVRQLADHKASLDPRDLADEEALVSYSLICGEILAKAHARTGDAAVLAGYCGRGAALDEALAGFATAYADQTERDHAQLVAAVRARRIEAASELQLRRNWHGLGRGAE